MLTDKQYFDYIKDQFCKILLQMPSDAFVVFEIENSLWARMDDFLPRGIWESNQLYIWGGIHFINKS